MTVHVVGNACLDTTFRLARFPRPGETLNARSGLRGVGGKGVNQAVAAARTGAAVALHAAVGSDPEGEAIRALLAGEGMDLSGLVTVEGPSDGSAILVAASGENVVVSLVDRARGFDPLATDAFAGRVRPGDIVLLQGNLEIETTIRCLALARAEGARTILNASPPGDDEDWRFDAVDWLVVNDVEARALSGADDREEAVRRLLRRGPEAVLLTLGPGGALLAGRHGTLDRVPAGDVDAIDTSGAGDALCGVFTGCLALGVVPETALRVAVDAAGLSVARPGTLASYPSAAEIAALRNS